MAPPGALTNFTQVTQLAPFMVFRGLDDYFDNYQSPTVWRASASYVTGAHNLKVGYQGAYFIEEIQDFSNTTNLTYLFLGPNQPIGLTMRIAPWQISNRTEYAAVYGQDQWTMGRVTLQGALRYDHAWSFFPAEHNGAPLVGPYNSAPITFPASNGVDAFNDITPRLGLAWDVRGDGKTSVRINAGKYLQGANNQQNYTISNPAMDGRNGRIGPNFQTTVNRTWTDANGNFLPDCSLINPAANGECGPWSSVGFGSTAGETQVDPAALSGWGVRPSDWQLGIGVQQEILPRTSIEVSYRRWFEHFFVFKNTLLTADDFSSQTITAPLNANLPGGGGYPMTYQVLNPGVPTNIQDLYTSADNYGGESVYWHGVDFTVTSRLHNGFVFQGGTSTGRGVTDFCALAAQMPEIHNTALTNAATSLASTPYQPVGACHVAENWLTQFRGLASYQVPKVDVLVSAIVQSKPNATTGPTDTTVGTNGTSLAANVTNPTGTTTYNAVQPGTLYGPRVNTVDLRAAKVLTFQKYKLTVGADLFNLFNANTGLTFNQNYGTGSNYLAPMTILTPRFVRINATVNF